MKKILSTLFALLCLQHAVFATKVVWFNGQQPITYSLPEKVEPVVKIALDMWKSDMEQVTGKTPVASSKSIIKIVKGKGAADGFHIYIKSGQIIVEGSNGRGMAYGILELSRLAGISPWIWWGDVVPEKKQRLTLDANFETRQQPSVEYRGIDGAEPAIYSLKEPFRSERWKTNVLNGQAVRDTKAHLSKGGHTLTICALDDHIVVDQITIL